MRVAARVARTVGAIVALLGGACAHAQLSGSAGLATDYRYRGLSLSDGQPAPQFSLNLDDDSGAFAGVSLARARLRVANASAMAIAYAGVARPLAENISWEAGVSQTAMNGAPQYNYTEVFAGLSRDRLSVRASYATHYFGLGGRTLYAEANGSWPLTDTLDVVAHGGYLHRVGPAPWTWPPAVSPRADVRIGLSYVRDVWTTQLAYSATREGAALYPGVYGQHSRGLVLSLARTF